MIYWFTGQPAHGKTVLGKQLVELLQTEKRNWRKDVFHVDGDDLRALTINKDYTEQGRINNIRRAQLLAEYLSSKGCDVVVSLVSPYLEQKKCPKETSIPQWVFTYPRGMRKLIRTVSSGLLS